MKHNCLFFFAACLPLTLGSICSCTQDDDYADYSIADKRATLTEIASQYGVNVCITDEALGRLNFDKQFLKVCQEYCNDLRIMKNQKYSFVRINDSTFVSVPQASTLTRGSDVTTYYFEGEADAGGQHCSLFITVTGSYEVIEMFHSDGSSSNITTNGSINASGEILEFSIDPSKHKPGYEEYVWEASIQHERTDLMNFSDSGVTGTYSCSVVITCNGEEIFEDYISLIVSAFNLIR